jgi:hypothetical protein
MNQSMLFLVFCTLATGAFATQPVVTIPLDKQHVPVVHNNRVVMNKTAYFGHVFFLARLTLKVLRLSSTQVLVI